jgi:hypothetical protein
MSEAGISDAGYEYKGWQRAKAQVATGAIAYGSEPCRSDDVQCHTMQGTATAPDNIAWHHLTNDVGYFYVSRRAL